MSFRSSFDTLNDDTDLDTESDEEYHYSIDLATKRAGSLQVARERSNESDLPQESNFEVLGLRSPDDTSQALWADRETNPSYEPHYAAEERRSYAMIVEDDGFTAREYGQALTQCNFRVVYALTVEQALKTIDQLADLIGLVVLDLRMPTGDFFSEFETVGGQKTGVSLAQEFLDRSAALRIVALSNSVDPLDIAWFEARENCHYCSKRAFPPELFSSYIKSTVMKDISSVTSFIIHGHDKTSALELKNYLQNRIGLPEPTILSERPSKGRTVIEKLEHHLKQADYVFALFTPDDFVLKPTEAKRARQNVVFEFGYVLGLLGRTSGRVFFLHKGDVEVPSDLHGMVYIDIANGVESAGEEIRRELEGLLRNAP